MSREIVHIQIGGYGNKTSSQYWKMISEEYGLDQILRIPKSEKNLEKIDRYFFESELMKGHYKPRSILVDLDKTGINQAMESDFGHNFELGNMVSRDYNIGTNLSFPKGYYTDGEEIIEKVLDAVRKSVERCENLQGFELNLNIFGGTGSGLGSLVMEKLNSMYDKKKIFLFCNFSSNFYDNIGHYITPYNAGFALQRVVDFADCVYIVDNHKIGELLTKQYSFEKEDLIGYKKMNMMIGRSMEAITSNLRFKSSGFESMDDICNNLIPVPRVKFLTVGFNAGIKTKKNGYKIMSVEEIYREVFDPRNYISRYDLRHGRLLAGFCNIRGFDPSYNPGNSHLSMSNFNSSYFAENFPNNYKLIFSKNLKKIGFNASYLLNDTAVMGILKETSEDFTKLFRRKAGIWEFLQEGMDEMEFTEAESNLNDVINEYYGANEAIGNDNYDLLEDELY